MVFAVGSNLTYSFIEVLSLSHARPAFGLDATALADADSRAELRSAQFSLSNAPGTNDFSGEHESRGHCDSIGLTVSAGYCESMEFALSKTFEGKIVSGEHESRGHCDSIGLTVSAGYCDSMEFALSKTFEGKIVSASYESSPRCGSTVPYGSGSFAISRQYDDALGFAVSNLLNLSDLVNSEICESTKCYGAGDSPMSQQLRISIIHGPSGLRTISSAFTATCRFGSSEPYFPDLGHAQDDQIQSARIVWTILGVVVAISLPIVGGIVLFWLNHSRDLAATMSETESEVEIEGGILSSLSGFEIFLSEENGLTDDDLCAVQNEAKDTDSFSVQIDESSLLM
jgi:hypothetical protein